MKNQVLLIGILMFFVFISSVFGGWERMYGGSLSDRGFAIDTVNGGGYIVSGLADSYRDSLGTWFSSFYLLRINENGDTLWTKKYSLGRYSFSRDVISLNDGFMILGVTSEGTIWSNYDLILIRTNLEGEIIWTKTYGGVSWEWPASIIHTDDGNFVIVGFSLSFSRELMFQVYLLKINPFGDTLWTRIYGEETDWLVIDAMQTEDKGFLMTGYRHPRRGLLHDFLVVKVDSLGDLKWARTYGKEETNEYGYSSARRPQNGYLITGWSIDSSEESSYVYLVSIKEDGDTLWTKFLDIGNTHFSNGYDILSVFDGYILIGSFYKDEILQRNMFIAKLDTNGNVEWWQSYGGFDNDNGLDIVKTSDNSYLITGEYGYREDDFCDQLYLVKTDSLGNTDIQENEKEPRKDTLIAYPNPFNQSVRIQLPDNCKEVEIVNNLGQQVEVIKGKNMVVWTPKENISSGLYFMRADNKILKIVYLK